MFFFFNDTATTEIYTLSLHDALPIWFRHADCWPSLPGIRAADLGQQWGHRSAVRRERPDDQQVPLLDRDSKEADRKSTRLNSSHANISYAVFCLKKKNAHSGLTLTNQ